MWKSKLLEFILKLLAEAFKNDPDVKLPSKAKLKEKLSRAYDVHHSS